MNSFELNITDDEIVAVFEPFVTQGFALDTVALDHPRAGERTPAMVEPFFDWNAVGSLRDYIIANDYFAGLIADLECLGLIPLYATVTTPSKLTLRPGLGVCRVR